MSRAQPDALPVMDAASHLGRGAPPPMVRLGGLPVTVLAALRSGGTAALAEQVLAERRSLIRATEALTGALHHEIGAATEPALRPRLVGLRRSLHRLRRPATGEWSDAVRAALPGPLVARVDEWLVRHQRLGHDLARLPELLAHETRHGQVALRRLAADPGHRRALWHSSPSLSAEVDKWLTDPGRQLRPQAAFRLAKYLARAATKTSPHSTFTVSGFGSWGRTEAGEHPLELRLPVPPVPTGVAELHGALTEQLRYGLARCPELWEALALRVNPSVTEEAGRLWFLGRPPAEPILSLPITPELAACVRLVDTDPPSPVGSVRNRLARATGAAAAATDGLLRYLVQTRLLEAWPATEDGPVPLSGSARWLRAAAPAHHPPAAGGVRRGGHRDSAGDDLAGLAGALDRLADGLREPVPVADVDAYRHHQESLRTTVAGVLDRLGGNRPRDRQGPVAADTAVAHGVLAECDPAGWTPVLADLDAFRRWVAGFNPALPLRLALAHWWHDRLGLTGEVPFVLFHHAVQAELLAGDPEAIELRRLLAGGPADPAASAFQRVRELQRLREQALDVFREAGQAGPERRVTGAGLAAAATGWPEWVPPVGSMGCYLQPLSREAGLAVVLEVVDTGYGRGGNRVAHLLRRAGAEPPVSGWRSAPPAGPVLAELAGSFGSTLNDRLPSVPYQLAYPFTAAGRRPAGRQLPLADLVVAAGPAGGLLQLRSRRLAAEVKALDLGLLIRPLLPPAARLLVQAFGDLAMVRPSQLVPALAPPASEGVQRLPRVWAGRVLLRRGGWVVAHAAVPRRQAGERDADYLLRLLDWRGRAGLPDRCFYRLLRPTRTGRSAGGLVFDKARKPTYLDFASWLLVRAFENALTVPAGVVLFEEALPDPAAAAAPHGAPRVVELLVEVSASEDPGETGAADGRR